MKGYIMDLQEQFEDQVADIVKESEHVAEAYASAVKLNNEHHFVNWENEEIEYRLMNCGANIGVIINERSIGYNGLIFIILWCGCIDGYNVRVNDNGVGLITITV